MKNVFFLFIILFNLNLYAQPGFPDNTFGSSGVAFGNFGNTESMSYSVFQQMDGKLLIAGTIAPGLYDDYFMGRFLSDGTPDSSFGLNGIVSGAIGNGDDQAFDVVQQADSKILLVGGFDNTSERDVFIRRYDSIGVLDTSFGTGGMVTTDFSGNSDDIGINVLLQPDGKIVVVGSSIDVSFNGSVMLLRYNTDGTLDSTFGNGGKVSFSSGGGYDASTQGLIQPDGKIVVVGGMDDGTGYFDVFALRFLPNGSLDSSFNGDGVYTYDNSGDDDQGWSVALQSDGKLLIGGLTITLISEDDLLIRLDTTGYPDQTFNSTGILIRDHMQNFDYITRVLVQQDGKILTVGHSYTLSESISLARYHPNGVVDSSFGSNGSIFHWISGDTYCNSAILQSDAKIVVSGSFESGLNESMFLSRYSNDSLSTNMLKVNVDEASIYPSPATDIIFLGNIKLGTRVVIYDGHGKMVYDQKLMNDLINVEKFNPGIYFLRTEINGTRFVRRFVKL